VSPTLYTLALTIRGGKREEKRREKRGRKRHEEEKKMLLTEKMKHSCIKPSFFFLIPTDLSTE
jgi:hypothetical protein